MTKYNALFVSGSAIQTKTTALPDQKTKDFAFDLKTSDTEKNIIEGYASTFGGDPDSHNDVIEMGAFAKTIKERGNDIKFLWQHDWNEPIGKIVDIYEDAKGLFIKVKISETTRGKEALVLAKDGVINRMSIGYSVIKHDYDSSTGIRTLKEIKLYEVSAVTFPSNTNAVITGAKRQNLEQSFKHFIAETIEGIQEGKAGKVLSDKNKKAVEEAVEALGKAVDTLNALLDATEGPKSDDEDPNKDPGADESAKSLESLIAQFTQKAESFKS